MILDYYKPFVININRKRGIATYTCGVCELEGKPSQARTHRFDLRDRKTGKDFQTFVCEKHYHHIESKESNYDIIRRYF